MSLKRLRAGNTVAVIGAAGKMGTAVIEALLRAGLRPEKLIGFDADKKKLGDLKNRCEINIADNNIAAARAGEIIIIAVKPQQMEEVLREIAPALTEDKLLISIAAGVSLERILKYVEDAGNFKDLRVVRVMPNICVTVGEGMTEICTSPFYPKIQKSAGEEDLVIAEEIFGACGKTIRVTEDKMHAVTALAGSGPGYGFLVIEALSNAGVREGLSAKDATMLAAQTMLGAAKMVLETGKHPAELRDMVTSPAGTTAAGLYVLEEHAVRAAFMEAVRAAVNRSKELGGEK